MQVGYVEEPDLLAIVEPCGYFYVHQACASWSKGVQRSCDTPRAMLTAVDSALIRAVSIRCHLCASYGASLTCPASVDSGGGAGVVGTGGGSSCDKSYHFPCAVSCGAYLNLKTFSCHCTDHIHQGSILAGIDAQCVMCRSPGNVQNQVIPQILSGTVSS